MAQRNPLNDRYKQDRTGKTRKSSASAKPKATRAATVKEPAPKTPKQKKQEAKEREEALAKKTGMLSKNRYEDTPSYKKLRRLWWVCLAGAIAATSVSFFANTNGTEFFAANPDGRWLGIFDKSTLTTISAACMITAYIIIIIAFWLDFGKIRKERKIFDAAEAAGNSKEARRAMKKAAAERRAELRKAEEAEAEEAKAAETEPEQADQAKKAGLSS